MSFDSISSGATGCFPRRAHTITATDEAHTHTVTVYMHSFNPDCDNDKLIFDIHKRCTTEELIEKVLALRTELEGHSAQDFDVFEMMGTPDGQTYKERRLDPGEYPVAVQVIWARMPASDAATPKNRFVFRHRGYRAAAGGTRFGSAEVASSIDAFLTKFLTQPQDREYADLCMLPELTEQTLLDNLRDRFNNGHIYTYIGPILVAVNPFCFFPIYNPKYARLYFQSRRLGALPPHIFAIADVCYHNMLRIKENQCVVISGESGSGKTESTNHLMSHLISLSQKGSTGCSTEQTLLAAGPVLEAFGNAVTLTNNNSSRFGKFIKINYRENGMVSGANVEIYLLEKSRIIFQAHGERNYHVFYYLLEGADEEERKNLFLLKPQDYNYLNQNEATPRPFKPEGINERNEFERLRHAMSSVGFCSKTQKTIFGIISAVLLLGNITYIKRHGYHSDESGYIENEEVVDLVSSLLHIKKDTLMQALTMKRHVMKAETVVLRYSVSEATNTRDAMAKCIYNSLFHYIVLRINQALLKRDSAAGKGYYIGILDIFGFEDVGAQWNSFEQLCINYANEKLQSYFNQHIFQFEQEEYQREGISWTNIEYTDNTECVQLFQSKPYGILRLIDEESNINNGTDDSMLAKLNQFLKTNEYYETPQKKEPAFIVAHYAGKVKYQITGFREKNKDLMRQDVLNALKSSTSSVMKTLLGTDPVAVHRWNVLRSVFRAMNAFKKSARRLQKSEQYCPYIEFQLFSESAGHLHVMDSISATSRRGSDSALSAFLRGELRCEVPSFCDTSMFGTIRAQARRTPAAKSDDKMSLLKSLQILKEAIGGRRVAKKPSSVSKQFEYSLTRLMSTLANATPYFIRCIKSNNDKIANHFDDNIILRQLRYTGMLETVRIRRAGYSVRIEYPAFVQQYRILLSNGRESNMEDVKAFIDSHPAIDSDNIQYGVSKIFMRDAEKLILDDHLHRTIMQHIDTLQRWFRAVLARKRYLRMKEGVIKIQALVRGCQARNAVRRTAIAAQTIQAHWRGYKDRRDFVKLRDAVLAIQSNYRGNMARKRYEEMPKEKKAGRTAFRVKKVHAVQLTTFDLNDPQSLAAFAASDDDDDEYDDDDDVLTQNALDDDEDEDDLSDGFQEDDDAIDVDATFILEDTKLKLIEGGDMSHHRRQSLAPTASTTKLKMLRRANSTESNNFSNSRCDDTFTFHLSPSSSKKSKAAGKLGFQKAKKNLKALFSGRKEDEDDASPGPSGSSELSPDSLIVSREHQFKMSRLHRQEVCALCNRHLTGFISLAHKCQRCKMCLHKECAAFASSIPCSPVSPVRSPTRLHSPKRPWDLMSNKQRQSASPIPTFSLTKTKQQKDPGNLVVETTDDLRQFSVFIFNKTTNLAGNAMKRDTVVDALFKKSLRAFHMELLGYEAVLSAEKTVLKYRDMITMFEGLLTKVCREEAVSFPTTLGVNAFRGFLNEFMHVQSKRKRGKEKSSMIKIHAGHRFRADVVRVPTYCEVCDQLVWHHEKMFICVACRISCHKKCHQKVTHACHLVGQPIDDAQNAGGAVFFGASLNSLVDDENSVPLMLDRLFFAIETRALFVEGVYRKSGSFAQVRNLRRIIETTKDAHAVNLDDVGVHVLTAIVKAFFREMPEPLIIYDLYENFLNVSEVEEIGERVRCLSVMIELLPKANRALLDRLMYHLARVADQEAVNKMGCTNLAVIFGPCLLRRQDVGHAQDQLNDVARQTGCVQTLIEEKLKQYKATLHNIVELEDASQKVSENLRKIEEHRRSSEPSSIASTTNIGTAKQLFEEQLEFLGKQKERLLQELPPLAPVASSEDLSSSDEHALNASKSLSLEEYALDLNAPPVFSLLPYTTKTRPRGPPNRRRPSHIFKREA